MIRKIIVVKTFHREDYYKCGLECEKCYFRFKCFTEKLDGEFLEVEFPFTNYVSLENGLERGRLFNL
jgi:hypothetical protein